jgi:hypothetical protein
MLFNLIRFQGGSLAAGEAPFLDIELESTNRHHSLVRTTPILNQILPAVLLIFELGLPLLLDWYFSIDCPRNASYDCISSNDDDHTITFDLAKPGRMWQGPRVGEPSSSFIAVGEGSPVAGRPLVCKRYLSPRASRLEGLASSPRTPTQRGPSRRLDNATTQAVRGIPPPNDPGSETIPFQGRTGSPFTALIDCSSTESTRRGRKRIGSLERVVIFSYKPQPAGKPC